YDIAGGILDQTTYDLTNLLQAAAAGGERPAWQLEYIFTQQWQLPRVDLASLKRLYSLSEHLPVQRERWHALFPVSSPVYWHLLSAMGEDEERGIRAFRCATGNALLPDYRKCYCGRER